MLGFLTPLEPVIAEQFARVHRAHRSIATTKVVGRTVLVAAPAGSLRMDGMERNLHASSLSWRPVGRYDRRHTHVLTQTRVAPVVFTVPPHENWTAR